MIKTEKSQELSPSSKKIWNELCAKNKEIFDFQFFQDVTKIEVEFLIPLCRYYLFLKGNLIFARLF